MTMSRGGWWGRVAGAVAEYQADNPANLPGAVFAVETRADGRLLGTVGAEWAADTICEIGSMTKPFVATAVLLALEERGRLDVEVPVHELPGMERYAADPVKRQVRLRHLLQHTSGLPHFRKYSEWPKTACNDPGGPPPSCADPRLDLGPTSAWVGAPALTNECVWDDARCRPARLVDLDRVSAHVMDTYPVAATPPPGTQYSYSTTNYILVARAVERLTGQSVNRYIKDRLFGPLGMKDSFFVAQPTGDADVDARLGEGVTDEQRARIADLTLITRDGRLPPEMAPGPAGAWDKFRAGWRFVNPDGGMFSTAPDLLNFLGMLRDGGTFQSRRVLSPAIVKLLVEDQGFGHTMGFGFRAQTTPYGQGAGTLEHMGYKMTYFWYDPQPDNPLVGVFLSQRLPNVAVNTNLNDGMHVIFRVFVARVRSHVLGAALGKPA
jgi:CubicO group peptidase (beta-lactamase class C family)